MNKLICSDLYAYIIFVLTPFFSTNAAITATITPEINEQAVNEIYLQTVAIGVDTFTTAQTADLLEIAQQCPPCGGDAVYRARSLYALIDKSANFNGIGCSGLDSRSSNKPYEKEVEKGQKEIRFSPNPASGEVMLSMPASGQEIELMVYSITGKLVLKNTLPAKTNQYRINTSILESGAYFFSLYELGKKIHTGQIIIIK